MFSELPELSDYYAKLVDTVSQFSFRVSFKSDGDILFDFVKGVADPSKDPQNFTNFANQAVSDFLQANQTTSELGLGIKDDTFDTWIVPTVQAGPLHIRQDEEIVCHFLGKYLDNDCSMFVSSPYLNFTENYQNLILSSKSKQVEIITASPKANGFYTAKDISRFIPHAYVVVERKLFEAIQKMKKSQQIKINEYNKTNWTFHAKGIWCFRNSQSSVAPNHSVVFIGSPNLSQRSTERDLESQLVIETKNKQLIEKFQKVKKKNPKKKQNSNEDSFFESKPQN